MDEERPAVAWHQALVFALTGEQRPGLGRQPTPDIDQILREIGPGPVGAYPVPADLMIGIGPAQFAAVLADLRARFADGPVRPVLADRSPDADERRLLADVPPHH